jgi:CheY-like chemotaxis protein
MHGLEASIILKGKPETAKIPIVALTVMSSPKFIEDCYKVGVSGFVRKPADPQLVLDSIIKVIGKPKRPALILAAAGSSDALTDRQC